jgi:curved DNA-binding protein CbpA
MSTPVININFNDLKYNLYDILGLETNASNIQIKKNFKKLIVLLHPDKNPDSNDEILNHVVLGNQILSNEQTRKDYDLFLKNKTSNNTFTDLKADFNNQIKDIEACFPKKDDAKNTFNSKINELNKLHGFNEHDSTNVLGQYENIKKKRNTQIVIPQEKITSNTDFNSKFEIKKEASVLDEHIVCENNSLSAYQPNDTLVSINDYSRLYVEDSVSTGSFTSLDMAFKLQKINTNFQNNTIEQKMKDYKTQTNHFSNRNPEDFSKKNFSEW